jgi:alanine dehydrogenase
VDASETLLLSRSEVAELLTLEDCIDAVETVFRLQGEDKIAPSRILGIHASNGGMHIKAGLLQVGRSYFVAKANTNFPGNIQRSGLPTIQGIIVVCDAGNGQPLAILDSIEITIKRTAAATAVAAKYLARPESSTVTLCGCGNQGYVQLRALKHVLPLRRAFLYDVEQDAARRLAATVSSELNLGVEVCSDLPAALRQSDICATCTPSRQFFIHKQQITPGTFIAAVGADNEDKQEINPELMASAKVVVDSLDQCATIGDLHHAIARGLTSKDKVHAELGQIVAGRKPGRTSAEEITIFDSTGVAIEDAVSAVAVYEKALASGAGTRFGFAA